MASAATPALAALTKAKVAHTVHRYEHDPAVTAFGEEVVQALGVDGARVWKTLVAQLDTGELVVGVVPVAAQLDLKALAQALGSKRAAMAPVALAEKSSGYVAGGISPIGQRKALRTVVDESATRLSTLFVSAGRRGIQVEIAPADLIAVTGARSVAIATGGPG
jgi:Cys-tRNA(Pro)/Cys-tRNA(Cys) deacylase